MLRTLPPRRAAPSKVNMWAGEAVEGSPWTRQQLKTLEEERPGRTRFDTHRVKLQPEPISLQDPLPAPIYVNCPVISRRRDGTRVLIVTPAGFKAWVNANG